MIRRIYPVIVITLIFLAGGQADAAVHKIALVIANSAYQGGGNLRNPPNDAQLVAGSLRAVGFDSVDVRQNLNLFEFEAALRDFKTMAASADIAVIYYAGHAIEDSGKNWMIPVDASLRGREDLPTETIDADKFMNAINRAKVRMVILDACRNNPFSRSWTRSTRGVEAVGLTVAQLDDYVIIYSAAPGQTASDGSGANSPFAASLARRIGQNGLPIQLLGNAVRDDVLAATGGEQRPYVSASISSTLVFLSSPTVTIVSGEGGKPLDQDTLDALAWQGALRADTEEAYADYKAQFPQGRFAKLAAANMKKLATMRPVQPVGGGSGIAKTRQIAPEDEPVATAMLNESIQAHNDQIEKKHQTDMEEYRQQIAALAQTSTSLQETYLQKVAAFKTEEARWQERATACRKNDVKKCGDAAAPPDMPAKHQEDPNEVIAWNEAVTVCHPPASASVMASQCEGPLGDGSAVVGTDEGQALMVKLCGEDSTVHDLGTSSGVHIFGCGFGIHPDDPGGKRKGNLDLAAKLNIAAIPGRASFRCARKVPRFCRTV